MTTTLTIAIITAVTSILSAWVAFYTATSKSKKELAEAVTTLSGTITTINKERLEMVDEIAELKSQLTIKDKTIASLEKKVAELNNIVEKMKNRRNKQNK